MLFPREVAPAAVSANQATLNRSASGVGRHGKADDLYATTLVSVTAPEDGQPGRIHIVALNNTNEPQSVLISQYATPVPIVVEGIDKNKNVDVSASPTKVEVRFNNLAPSQQLGAIIRYHLAPPIEQRALRNMRGRFSAPFAAPRLL
jgi:hypothetical protein